MDKIKLDLSVFSLARSGSTMLINFLRKIFVQSDGNIIQRLWDVDGCDEYLDNFKFRHKFVIINMRDFRDIAASRWRADHATYDKDGVVNNKMIKELVRTQSAEVVSFIKLLNCIVDNNPHALVLQYEDYWDNIDNLIEKLEEYIGFKIPEELLKDAKDEVDFDRYKKISEEQGLDFSNYNIENAIHAKHIYTGKPGTWKEFVNPEDYKSYEDPMLDGLRRYGYGI